MAPPTLLSSTLRRLTVSVSVLTSALFALLASAILVRGVELTPVFFFPIFWFHCYVPGYVSYDVATFGRTRDVVTVPHRVRDCVVCGSSDDSGVVREYSEQFVVAGIPLATTDEGKNEYCNACHAVEFSLEDDERANELEAETVADD